MINILYSNLNEFSDNDFNVYLKLLPVKIQGEILRYRFIKEQKSRLLGKLMLYSVLKQDKKEYLLENYKRDGNNKPWIVGWLPFNISHSGDMVVFSYSSLLNGIDIEEKNNWNLCDFESFFHEKEIEVISKGNIRSSDNALKIWVKKEAFLKALGTGLVNDLQLFDCSECNIEHGNQLWSFFSITIRENYMCYLCTLDINPIIVAKKFVLESVI